MDSTGVAVASDELDLDLELQALLAAQHALATAAGAAEKAAATGDFAAAEALVHQLTSLGAAAHASVLSRATTLMDAAPSGGVGAAKDAVVAARQAAAEASAEPLLHLFEQYCSLSKAYAEAGGWQALDSYRPCVPQWPGQDWKPPAPPLLLSPTAVVGESKQIHIARQHLYWMLGKEGHGRSVQFVRRGAPHFKKPCHLLLALKDASSLEDLIAIARKCLTEVVSK